MVRQVTSAIQMVLIETGIQQQVKLRSTVNRLEGGITRPVMMRVRGVHTVQ